MSRQEKGKNTVIHLGPFCCLLNLVILSKPIPGVLQSTSVPQRYQDQSLEPYKSWGVEGEAGQEWWAGSCSWHLRVFQVNQGIPRDKEKGVQRKVRRKTKRKGVEISSKSEKERLKHILGI